MCSGLILNPEQSKLNQWFYTNSISSKIYNPGWVFEITKRKIYVELDQN